jgi:hypothetical protein
MDLREIGLGGCGLNSTVSGQGPVAGSCGCGDEPSGSCATELVSMSFNPCNCFKLGHLLFLKLSFSVFSSGKLPCNNMLSGYEAINILFTKEYNSKPQNK